MGGAGGLVLMVALFIGVLVALRPANKKKFDRLARLPLHDGDGPDEKTGDRTEADK